MSRFATRALALTLLAGCSLAFDGSEHTGGTPGTDGGPGMDAPGTDAGTDGGDVDAQVDGGCPDEDGDGHPSMACGGDDCDDTEASIYPGAPPVCETGTSERCPGDARLTETDFADDLDVIGVLPPNQLIASDGMEPKLAMAATDIGGGGYGTAIVIGLVPDGSFHRMDRRDVSLNDTSTSTEEPIMGRTGVGTETADLRPLARVQGVDLRRYVDDIGIGITGTSDVDTVIGWRGVIDLLSGTSSIAYISGGGTTTAWGEPAVLTPYVMWRESGSPPTFQAFAITDPPALSIVNTGVPTGEARVVSTTGDHGLLQQTDGRLCFFTPLSTEMGCTNITSQEGHAAFGELGSGYLAVYSTGSQLELLAMDCSRSFDPYCVPAPRVSPVPVIDTGASSSQAFDLVQLPTGNGLVLYVANHPDGDTLYVQPVRPTGDAAGERVEVMSLRGENRRFLDGELDITDTATALTLSVAVVIGESFSDTADELVFTGLRGCRTD